MARKTILIIDTDKELMQRMISTFEAADYLVFTALSKNDGIHLAKSVNPSVIFINIGMSGVSAVEIGKIIHDEETLKNIPIVIITPHGGTVEPRYTSLYGIVDFLKTTFSPEELITKTQDILFNTIAPQEPAGEIPEQTAEEHSSLEKEPEKKPFEEAITVPPVREEIEAHLVEELMEQDKTETKPAEKAEQDIAKEDAEEFLSGLTDRDMSDQKPAEKKPEQADSAAHKQTEEIFPDLSPKADGTESSFTEEKKESGKKNRSFIPLIILILILLTGTGILLYRNMWHGQKIDMPVTLKPSIPAEKQAVEIQPPQQQEKLQPFETVKPATSPSPSPEPKQTVKSVYAVQIGAFKSEQNALSISKKYKEKNYDSRIYKSTANNKGILYRVLIGNFHNKEEATKLAKTIRTQENINVIIFHQSSFLTER